MLFTGRFYPGTTAAATNIALPATWPALAGLTQVILEEATGAALSTVPINETIVTAAPAAGQAQLVNDTTIQFGSALDNFAVITVTGYRRGGRFISQAM